MYSVLLTIHVLVTAFLIGIILIQRSASDGMGLSGSSSTSLLSGRAAASAVTRATAILATLFIMTSLGLGIITARSHPDKVSILDRLDSGKPAAASTVLPAGNPAATVTVPAAPTTSPLTAPMTPPATPPVNPSVPRPQ
jgi:preprotein translocase subunit SecG